MGKRRRILWTIGGLVVFSMLFIGVMQTTMIALSAPEAMTLYVAPNGDCGTGTFVLNCFADLQVAVDAATPGSEIRVATGVYTHIHHYNAISYALYLSKTLTIRGGFTTTNWQTSHPYTQPTILDLQGQGRGIIISGDISPTLQGLHIRNGVAGALELGGGIYINGGHSTFKQIWILNNTAGYGGGVAMFKSKAHFINTVIAQNQAETLGNGLYAVQSEPHFIHTTLADNGGNGVHVVEGYQGATIVPSTLYLTNTIVSGHNVGLYVNSGNSAFLHSTLWASNTTNLNGWGNIQSIANVTGTADFVASAQGNYHIDVYSAARERAIDTGIHIDHEGESRPAGFGFDIGADECWRPGLEISQRAAPEPVKAGTWLTYTITITNTGAIDLHATMTDTLPRHVSINTNLGGSIILPERKLVWTSTITAPGGIWTQEIPMLVDLEHNNESVTIGYNGPLVNVVQVSTLQGISKTITHTATAFYFHKIHMPLVMKVWFRPKNVLLNPGFEGIGLPEDNDAPNPDNWTRDTFNGNEYGEIFTPEGWVTWWEEDVGTHGRPEVHVIPYESPYIFDPIRIHQGYYAAMYFTFWRTHHAGYYQQVTNLPPGRPVEAYAYAQGWSCNEDNPLGYTCGDPENLGFYVGVDPTGGTDPWSETIIWSTRTLSPDAYRKIGPVYTRVGTEGQITIFLRSDVKWPYKHNDAYWDNAALLVPIRQIR